MGGRIDFNFDDIYFSGNMNILNNVAVQGSMFVNGELYCTHMTTMGQRNFTKDSADLTGFINPSQSFVVFEGASAQAAAIAPFITCAITLQLPDPFGEMLNIPCLIKFPNGISLASDKVLTDTRESKGTVSQGSARTSANVKSDLIGPGHNHEFIGPSCEYTASTSETFKEAKKAMESKTPSKAKKTVPNGASSMKQFLQQCEDAVAKRMKDYALRAKKYVLGIFKD
jgi:biotin-(acetyl-CoA carboxylase) ligase